MLPEAGGLQGFEQLLLAEPASNHIAKAGGDAALRDSAGADRLWAARHARVGSRCGLSGQP